MNVSSQGEMQNMTVTEDLQRLTLNSGKKTLKPVPEMGMKTSETNAHVPGESYITCAKRTERRSKKIKNKVEEKSGLVGVELKLDDLPEQNSGNSKKSRKRKSAQQKKLNVIGVQKHGIFEYDHSGALISAVTQDLQKLMTTTHAVAVDCEMVGVGPGGMTSSLTRVSIVKEHGYCLYDMFVKPPVEIIDYRTDRSGIRKEDLENAPPSEAVKKVVAKIVEGRILIGHSLQFDLMVLGLDNLFPLEFCRDTAIYFEITGQRKKTPGLKKLAHQLLKLEIQEGEHNSIIDAQAAMAIYHHCKKRWESRLRVKDDYMEILRKRLEELKSRIPDAEIPFSSQRRYNASNQ